MRTTVLAVGAAALAASALVAVPAQASSHSSSHGLKVVGLTADGHSLVRFTSDSPRNARTLGRISGLAGDTSLIGIDYRVQDGLLYGVGNAGGIYTIAARGAMATKVGALTVPLDGIAFGVDFNPAANALRVVSDRGQNLRHPFAGATAGQTQVDTALTISPAPATGSPAATGVTGIAYTNNDLSPDTGTTLFDLDTRLDQVAVQSPANAGVLVATGKLGVDAGPRAGFDIYSTLTDGRTDAVAGFAALTVGSSSAFYRIDLLTGRAQRVGSFRVPVSDIAIPLAQR